LAELLLNQIAENIKGKILQGSPSISFHRFNIDSRLIEPGDLFFALKGERNGHNFVSHALEKGAAGAVISKEINIPLKDFALIKVKDTLNALQELAQKLLKRLDVKVVDITGSIGKTTTKEFTFELISTTFNTLKSEGNFNNHLGLPLSILKLTKDHEVAVFELGMNSPGEIKALSQIAPPDIAVITNIKPVHLQFFKNLKEIALEKKEMLMGIRPGGVAILNGDDTNIRKFALDWKGKKIYFGLSRDCKIRAKNINKNGLKGISFDLTYGKIQEKMSIPFLYESYIYNFLAALTVAYALDIPYENISQAIKSLRSLPMRGTLYNLKNNINLIDDTYNSNPAALESALKSLADIPAKRKLAVLGDMLELGQNEEDYHIQAGKQVYKYGWDILVTVGPISRYIAQGAIASGMDKNQIFSFENSEETAEGILSIFHEGDLILVKGSRGMKTEKIVEIIKKNEV